MRRISLDSLADTTIVNSRVTLKDSEHVVDHNILGVDSSGRRIVGGLVRFVDTHVLLSAVRTSPDEQAKKQISLARLEPMT